MTTKAYNNALQPGTELRSPNHIYKIRTVLGRGGFGITYSATFSTQIGNLPVTAVVAIKEHFISGDCERKSPTQSVSYSAPSAQRVERSRRDFTGEARRLQSIATNHSNIVQVSEVFDANNTSYYVMEYLEGESLANFIKHNGPLSEQQTLQIMTPLIQAVGHLHSNRITHLDIKPANIMLSTDKKGQQRPVLIDFGLSKHYNPDGSATSTINIQGFSEGYAPVEQYVGINTFSPQSDVYSLAATILFCLTGQQPPKSIEMTADRIKSVIPATTSSTLRNALTQAFNMAQINRPANANALLSQFKGLSNTTSHTQNQHLSNHDEPSTQKISQTSTVPANLKDITYDNPNTLIYDTHNDTADTQSSSKTKLWLSFIIGLIIALMAYGYYENYTYHHAYDNDNNNIIENTTSNPTSVDLGLPSGTRWATTNIGANSPEEFGNLYAWGETSPKSIYTWENYLSGTMKSNKDIGTGNDPLRDYVYPNNKSIAGTQYDAATVNWGSSWQMPSDKDIYELLDNCFYEWTQYNNVNGILFTSKINNKTIFIPAQNYDNTGICVWTAYTHDPSGHEDHGGAHAFVGYKEDLGWLSQSSICRFEGHPIRPVIKK